MKTDEARYRVFFYDHPREAPMTTNDTRTQERIEQAVAAHLDSATPERYAYIMKHLGPWTDGYLTRDAEPTTVSAEQIEAAAYQIASFEGFNYHGMDAGDRGFYDHLATVAFRAAGIAIEGDPA